MGAVLGDERLVVDHLVLHCLEHHLLDALRELLSRMSAGARQGTRWQRKTHLQCRLGLLDGGRRWVHCRDDRDACVARQRRLEDLRKLGVAVGDVGPVEGSSKLDGKREESAMKRTSAWPRS